MAEQEHAQIYLITPPDFDLSGFSTELAGLLDSFPVACVRLRSASEDADSIGRSADLLRDICHQRDVPIVMETHFRLIESHGLDGVHLVDSRQNLRDLRKELGQEAIIGSYCGSSRHAGITAGEAGADYVAFGPVTETPLGSDTPVEFETFEWWSQMIELPVVAEGAITLDMAEKLAPVTDFFAFGSELWSAPEGAKTMLQKYIDRF